MGLFEQFFGGMAGGGDEDDDEEEILDDEGPETEGAKTWREWFAKLPPLVQKMVAGAISGIIVAGIVRKQLQVEVDAQWITVRLSKAKIEKEIGRRLP